MQHCGGFETSFGERSHFGRYHFFAERSVGEDEEDLAMSTFHPKMKSKHCRFAHDVNTKSTGLFKQRLVVTDANRIALQSKRRNGKKKRSYTNTEELLDYLAWPRKQVRRKSRAGAKCTDDVTQSFEAVACSADS